MNVCPNCQKELADGVKFCDSCGTPIQQPAPQPVAEQPAPVVQPASQPVVEQPVQPAEPYYVPAVEEAPQAGSQFPVKWIGLGAAVVAIVVVLALLVSIIFSGGAVTGALYVKDKEIYYSDFSDDEPWQITDDFWGSNDETPWGTSRYAKVTEDGKMVFFLDETDEDCSLCYRYTNDPEEDAVKLDSDVESFAITADGDCVTYITDDGALYQHDLDEKVKIDKDVDGAVVSNDGEKILYGVSEDSDDDYEMDLYFYQQGADQSNKIASSCNGLEYANDELSVVYYTKSNALYKVENDSDPEKLASDVSYVLNVTESGEAYFILEEETEKEVKLSDYVNDDLKSSDAAMVRPTYPSWYSYYQQFSDFDTADAQYDLAVDKYYEQWDAYQEKLTRDNIRSSLETYTMDYSVDTLCYYNGKEVVTVAENVTNYTYAYNAAVVAYSVFDDSKIKKVKISEITSTSELEEQVTDAIESSSAYSVVVNGESSAVALDDIYNIDLSDDGTVAYILANAKAKETDDESDGELYGDMYMMEIGSKAGKPEQINSNVSADSSSYFVGENTYIYYADYNSEKYTGDLYINNGKEAVDADVYGYVTYIEESGALYYLTDYSSTKYQGTLKVYKDGQAETIADDVHDYEIMPDGTILYLQDYDTDKDEGSLYLYDGETQLVDDDVTAIIPMVTWSEEAGYQELG